MQIIIGLKMALYSLNQINQDYQGPILSIQKPDGTVVNLNSNTFGNLFTYDNPDTYADGLPIEAILEGNPAYVYTWWDQSGNSQHLMQIVQGLQPIYDTILKTLVFNGNSYLAIQNGILPNGTSQYLYSIDFFSFDESQTGTYVLCEHNARTITPCQRAALCIDNGNIGFKGVYNDAISNQIVDTTLRNKITLDVDNTIQSNIQITVNDTTPVIMNSAYNSQDTSGYQRLYLNNYWFGVGMNMSTLESEGFSGLIYSLTITIPLAAPAS